MSEADILTALKVDLQISSTALDEYLGQLMKAARDFIAQEGIVLTDSVGDGMLVEMYAAYLYRRRREPNASMPRMLRWALNNKAFGGGSENG